MATYDREKMRAAIDYLNGDEDFVKAKGAIIVKPEEMDDKHIASLLHDALTYYDPKVYNIVQCPHCLEEMPSPEPEEEKENKAEEVIVCVFCGNNMNKKPEPVKEPTVEEVQKEQMEVMGDLDDAPKPEEPKKRRKRRTKEQIIEDQKRLAAELAKEKQKDIPELAAEKPVAKEVKSSAPIGVSEDVAKQVLANDTKVVVQEKAVKEDKEEVKTGKSLWLSDVLTDDMSITLTVAQLKSLLNVEK
jgi:hypothetical protein